MKAHKQLFSNIIFISVNEGQYFCELIFVASSANQESAKSILFVILVLKLQDKSFCHSHTLEAM
jgi:hypothetical protein